MSAESTSLDERVARLEEQGDGIEEAISELRQILRAAGAMLGGAITAPPPSDR